VRQREISTAVAPLIEREGARRLSIRQAAAGLSIGGLYHDFPTKRELVLHGLCLEAIVRRCQDFHAQFEPLAEVDPHQFRRLCEPCLGARGQSESSVMRFIATSCGAGSVPRAVAVTERISTACRESPPQEVAMIQECAVQGISNRIQARTTHTLLACPIVAYSNPPRVVKADILGRTRSDHRG
jgi:AcrR family transcriptional regulator